MRLDLNCVIVTISLLDVRLSAVDKRYIWKSRKCVLPCSLRVTYLLVRVTFGLLVIYSITTNLAIIVILPTYFSGCTFIIIMQAVKEATQGHIFCEFPKDCLVSLCMWILKFCDENSSPSELVAYAKQWT